MLGGQRRPAKRFGARPSAVSRESPVASPERDEPPSAVDDEFVRGACAEWAAREGVAAGSVGAVMSPYRICPIGAHIDHQGGPVLGLAIGAHTLLVFSPAEGPSGRLTSANFPGDASFDLRRPVDVEEGWGRYVGAAARAFADEFPDARTAIYGKIRGSLPGGGLSSSASALLAVLAALASANGIALDLARLVKLAHRAENRHVGVASGILDPASIAGGRRGHLVSIDTRSETWETLPLGGSEPARFLVAFTGVARNLQRTGFNLRVEECRSAARRLSGAAFDRLSDVAVERLRGANALLPENEARRVRHFVGECGRVHRGIERWRQGDLDGFGELMSESCRSSIECYETGSPELIRLQEILLATPGVRGARFSGAGFGGCSVALLEDAVAEGARDAIAREFGRVFPDLAPRARFFLAESGDGLRLV
jgi:galactokinase